MHRCLSIDEILPLIFEHIDPNEHSAQLAALASMRRAFTDPALNILWRDQRSLGPLVRCMPADLWSVIERDGRAFIDFHRPLLDTDWARFDYYAIKIRRLGFCIFPKNPVDIHTSALLALSTCRSRRVLLPNLDGIQLGLDLHKHYLPYSEVFLGPNLRHIEIWLNAAWDKSSCELLWPSIVHLSPGIQHLYITPVSRIASIPSLPLFFNLVCGLHGLRELVVPATIFPDRIINHLGNLPNLTRLATLDTQPSDIHSYTTTTGQFPTLKVFNFVSSDWKSAATILNEMRCGFTYLEVSSKMFERYSGLGKFTEAILHHPSRATLTKISFVGKAVYCTESDDVAAVFQPLFACSALESVRLIFPIIANLGDSWLANAALAWPSLRVLGIRTVSLEPSKMTLAGLVPIVRHCPHLHFLSIGLDAAPVDPALLGGVCNTLIEDISFGSSTIQSPGRVTRSLIRMFPNLSTVSVFAGGEQGEAWEKVRELLRVMSAE